MIGESSAVRTSAQPRGFGPGGAAGVGRSRPVVEAVHLTYHYGGRRPVEPRYVRSPSWRPRTRPTTSRSTRDVPRYAEGDPRRHLGRANRRGAAETPHRTTRLSQGRPRRCLAPARPEHPALPTPAIHPTTAHQPDAGHRGRRSTRTTSQNQPSRSTRAFRRACGVGSGGRRGRGSSPGEATTRSSPSPAPMPTAATCPTPNFTSSTPATSPSKTTCRRSRRSSPTSSTAPGNRRKRQHTAPRTPPTAPRPGRAVHRRVPHDHHRDPADGTAAVDEPGPGRA
jgi:hypothetical protein